MCIRFFLSILGSKWFWMIFGSVLFLELIRRLFGTVDCFVAIRYDPHFFMEHDAEAIPYCMKTVMLFPLYFFQL